MSRNPHPVRLQGLPQEAQAQRLRWQDPAGYSDDDPEGFADEWLDFALQEIGGIEEAVVKIRDGSGLLRTVASRDGGGETLRGELTRAVDVCLARQTGVARRLPGVLIAAYPLTLDGQAEAVVAVAVRGVSEAPEQVLAQLRWCGGWLWAWILKRARAQDAPSVERAKQALNVLGDVLDAPGFRKAAQRATTGLARLLVCDRVSFGTRSGGSCRVAAMSDTANFGGRLEIANQLAAAMDEAVEQNTALMVPMAPDAPPLVTRCHEVLRQRHPNGSVLTMPVLSRGRVSGAFTCERMSGEPFDQPAIDLLEAAAALVGSMLEERRRADRWIAPQIWDATVGLFRRLVGPRHFALKLSALTIALLGMFLSLATAEYRVTSDAALEGRVQRTIVAPFQGFVTAAERKAGDTVEEGDVLARLDERDLALERLRLWSEKQRREVEYDQALGERDRASLNVIRAQVEQTEAQLSLVDRQLERATIRAPFSGIVVAGDLTQSIGASVSRGEELFRIAPLDSYRVVIWVDERQIDDVAPGDNGAIVLAALPSESFPLTVEVLTPVSEARDGQNSFRVEASLDAGSPGLRPGMNGIAKVDAGERRLIWIWTRTFVDWARLAVWRWTG